MRYLKFVKYFFRKKSVFLIVQSAILYIFVGNSL